MSDVLRRTWLPTLLFTVPVFCFELFSPGQKTPPLSSWTFYTMIAVPVVWWLTTARRGRVSVGRGAAGGAMCGAVIILIPAIIEMTRVALQPRDGSGDLATMMGIIGLIIAAAILVPIGTGIGALTALLQKPGSPERSS